MPNTAATLPLPKTLEEQDVENGFVTINRKKLRLSDIYRNVKVD